MSKTAAICAATVFALAAADRAAAQISQTVDLTTYAFQSGRILAESNGANATTTVIDFGANALRIGDTESGTANDRGFTSLLSFRTSSIPANVVVTAATLFVTRGGSAGSAGPAFGAPILELKTGFYGTSTYLSGADFLSPPDLTPAGTLTVPVLPNSQSSSALPAASLPFINKAGGPGNGVTQMKIRYPGLTDNDGVTDYIGFYSAWNGTASRRPFLRVTYTNPAANISVSPGGIDFDDQDVDAGPTAAVTLTISNLGTGNLTIASITLGGPDASMFSISSDTGQTTLTPGQTRTLMLRFNPAPPFGPRTGSLTINSSDTNTPIVNVPLTGLGLDQEVDAAPDSLSFGPAPVGSGQTPSQPVGISSLGNADLAISSVSLTGIDSGDFAITGDSGENTLPPGMARTVNVAFNPPASPGVSLASLAVATNDSDEPTTNVLLSGIAQTLTPSPTATPTTTPTVRPSPSATLTPTLTASPTPTATASPTPNASEDWGLYE